MKKKRIVLREKSLWVEIYNADISRVIGSPEMLMAWAKKTLTKDKFEKFAEYSKENPITEISVGRTYHLGGGGCIIWLKEWDIDTYVHEIIHAARFLFAAKSTEINEHTDEPFAYLVEYLFKNLMYVKR